MAHLPSSAAGRAALGLAIGAAGQRMRVNAGASAGEWAEPDVVCTVAELASTYAPSAVLRGVIAYTTDAGVTYVCRRTASTTYAWALLAAGATAAAARTAIGLGTFSVLDLETLFPRAPLQTALHRHRLDEASGAIADTGSGAVAATLVGAGWSQGVAGPYRGRLGISQAGSAAPDCVVVTPTTIPAAGFTIAVTFISKTRIAPTGYQPIVSANTGAQTSGAWNELSLAHKNDGAVYMTMAKGSSFEGSGTSLALNWARAHRALFTYLSGTKTATLYIDGAVAVTYTHGPAAIGDCSHLTGLGGTSAAGYTAGNEHLVVSDAQAWGRVLTAAEIAVDYSTLAGSLL